MVGWIFRILMAAAATVTGWFVARDKDNFDVVQMVVAILLIAFFVIVAALGPSLVVRVRSWWRTEDRA